MVNVLDLVVAAALAFFLIRGLFRGLFLEAASLVAVVLAFYAANGYHTEAGPFFGRWLDNPALTHLVAYAVLFILVMIGVSLLARFIRAVLRIKPVTWLELTGGALIGTAKGLGIVLVALAVLSVYASDTDFMQGSLANKYLKPATKRVQARLPGSMAEFDPQEFMKELDESDRKALEKFLGSDSQSKGLLDKFMNADPEKRQEMIDKYMQQSEKPENNEQQSQGTDKEQ
jgi:membrane protein required for colicin V production